MNDGAELLVAGGNRETSAVNEQIAQSAHLSQEESDCLDEPLGCCT